MLLLLLFPRNHQVLPEARLLGVGNVLRLSDVSYEQKRLYTGVQDDLDLYFTMPFIKVFFILLLSQSLFLAVRISLPFFTYYFFKLIFCLDRLFFYLQLLFHIFKNRVIHRPSEIFINSLYLAV